jgi:serine/threonine protein kinase
MRYLAQKPPGSPTYGAESPTTRRLRRAALKSEGQKISPGSPRSRFSCASGKKLKLLGKGRQGIVFKGNGFAAKVCPRDLAAAVRKEKQPALVEYDIQVSAFDACPGGVVTPYEFHKCIDFIHPSTMNMENVQNSRKYDKSKQSIIFMELCSGGSLEDWLKQKGKTDAILHHVISSVIKTLGKIYKKYPEFRHNDLWPANILVADRGFLISDFGWSRLLKNGTNPAVNTANGTHTSGKWGIGPNTDMRYDYHFFLNNMLSFVKRKGGLPKTLEFLESSLPIGYRGESDTHVNEWRLKYNDPCPGLPSFAEILQSKYISGPKRVAARPRHPVTLVNIRASRNKLKKAFPRRVITPTQLQDALKRLKPGRKTTPPKRVAARPRHPVTLVNIRASRNKLKKAFPRRVITPTQLRDALKRLKPGRKTTARIPPAFFKSKNFDKLIEYYWKENGAVSGKNFDNAWSKARNKAIRFTELQLDEKIPLKSPVRRVSAPKIVQGLVKKIKPKVNNKVTRLISPPKLSPSGRPKVMGHKGRMVYADLHYSLADLKRIATTRGKNIKGLRSKESIARKIFS